jgi:hypothetical protein
MIFYEQQYHDERGQTVIQHHIVEGMPPSDFPEFLGVGYIQIQTPIGPQEQRITVPIAASDLRGAFMKFQDTMEKEGPETAKRVMEELKRKMMEHHTKQQSKIITPGDVPLPPFKGLTEK